MVLLLWCSSNQGCKVDGIPPPFKRLFLGTEPLLPGFPLDVTLNCAHISQSGSHCDGATRKRRMPKGLNIMKNLIILAVIAVAGVGVWLFSQSDDAPEQVQTAAETATDTAETAAEATETTTAEVEAEVAAVAGDAEGAVDEAVEGVTAAVEEAIADATVAADTVANDVTEAATVLADEAGDRVDQAITAVNDAASEAATALDEALSDVTDGADDTIDATGDAVSSVAEVANSAASDTMAATESVADAADATEATTVKIEEFLTVDGFDYDRVVEYIDNSELSLLIKTSTKAALEQARNNPEQLQALLGTLRDQLGL